MEKHKENTPAATGEEACAQAQAQAQAPAKPVEPAEQREQAGQEGPEETMETVKKRLAELESRLSDNEDRYKRMLAEYDNFRKRCAREREGLFTDSFAAAVALFLPVLDNLERAAAQQSCDAEAQKGAEMMVRQFYEILDKSGVSPVGEPGEAFDPGRHNAIMHVEDENFGENQICEVLLRGFIMGDRVIRHAMVKVAN